MWYVDWHEKVGDFLFFLLEGVTRGQVAHVGWRGEKKKKKHIFKPHCL